MLGVPIVNSDTVVIGFPPACQNPSQQGLMCLLKTQTDGEVDRGAGRYSRVLVATQ